MNRRGLGRGLGALLSSTPAEGEALLEVPIDLIAPNPNQPRKSFDSNGLSELTASIRTSGVIQPVVVRRQGQGYQLIAGERRWRAAKIAGLERIPALLREASDGAGGRAPAEPDDKSAPGRQRPTGTDRDPVRVDRRTGSAGRDDHEETVSDGSGTNRRRDERRRGFVGRGRAAGRAGPRRGRRHAARVALEGGRGSHPALRELLLAREQRAQPAAGQPPPRPRLTH